MPTNPQSGVTLTESMGDELRSRNNLSDLFNRATAITNLGITATAAETSQLAATPSTVTIALAASVTTDGMDITVTAKDAAGATLTGLHAFTLHFSEAATGAGLTADTYSGSLTASSGAVLGTMTAKKCFLIQTHTDGVFVGTLVDSANPADQYVAVKKPVLPGYVVSAASGVNWEGI